MLNPFSFRPGPVTFWTTVVYLALVIPLVVINETVPPPPGEIPRAGLNLTEAWHDLAILTKAYHPYNSRASDEVRAWLLQRVRDILDQNGVSWGVQSLGTAADDQWASGASASLGADQKVTVFDDLASNYSCTVNFGHLARGGDGATAAYFEGTNILVYIRGTDDPTGDWWESDDNSANGPALGQGGTMVNAHYDSVSTAFGATDDGMGVISVLQVVKYFTTPGHQPKRGIVALLNNGEEDFLYGARALGQSPLLPFIHTFLNLEGAGAGGRANLFRTTDQEVTAAYAKTDNPFGSVISSDSFGLGVIRSETDFSVLTSVYGQRGLDLAFLKPRSRYHTSQDDARHASRASLWHMLSSTVHTIINLSGDTGGAFAGPRADSDKTKVQNGHPSTGVWFDLFGKGFLLFNLRGMFAWSLTILIVPPLVLALVTYLLVKADRYYFFSNKVRFAGDLDGEAVSVRGLRGFFRFPLALLLAVALTLGGAFLLRKENPLIIYSSPYAVWAMMISLFYFVFWLITRGASFVRPSALYRGYAHIWLFSIGWVLLVGVTVLEDRFSISAGYFFVFFESAIFLSTLITLVELSALPKKSAWAQEVREDYEAGASLLSGSRHDDLISPTPGEAPSLTGRDRDDGDDQPEPVNETTPLVGGSAGENPRSTFGTTYRRSLSAIIDGPPKAKEDEDKAYQGEQLWSQTLPSWPWFLQFLIIGPFIIVLAAQTGLPLVDAVRQTGTDGSSTLVPYLVVVLFTALLLLPITPFVHRVPYHIPVFFLAVFVGTLIYNLVAFPFSASNQFKVFFQQTIDVDTGETINHFSGLEEYVRLFIPALPSSAGQQVSCTESSRRKGTVQCSYDASSLPPNLGNDDLPVDTPPQEGYADLIRVNATRGDGPRASFEIDAVNTKACFIHFATPVTGIEVVGGSGWDGRFGKYPGSGVELFKLWRRDWDKKWRVDVEWADKNESSTAASSSSSGRPLASPDESRPSDELVRARTSDGLEGFVSCQWSDANTQGTIPALEEAHQYSPSWAEVTKYAEGLVEGKKRFAV